MFLPDFIWGWLVRETTETLRVTEENLHAKVRVGKVGRFVKLRDTIAQKRVFL